MCEVLLLSLRPSGDGMSIVLSVLEEAARGVLAAAMTGLGMQEALDALSQAADAHGALIGRNPDKGAKSGFAAPGQCYRMAKTTTWEA
jgi:hypothetical protein